jgi:UrcA family protein
MVRLNALIPLAAFVMLPVGAAMAAEPERKLEEIGNVRVSYGDLDLRQDTDVRVLLSRLEKAAWRACGGDPKFHSSYAKRPAHLTKVYEECRERAVTAAVDRIGAPALAAALHREPPCEPAG